MFHKGLNKRSGPADQIAERVVGSESVLFPYPPALFINNAGNAKDWLVGWFGLNGPLRQYFSLYWTVSQRGRKKREKIDERTKVQTTPTRTYCKRNKPLPYCHPNQKDAPGTESLSSAFAPPDHPCMQKKNKTSQNFRTATEVYVTQY